jgi:pyruvate dehydrogenase E2 component (dihydrolipoamide acetyltransferase)
MTEIAMPRLSDSMEEGTILCWLKRDGEPVEPGDELLEIETDKATMTYTAEAGGILTTIAPEGATLPVGAPIARLGAVADVKSPTPSDAGPTAGPEPVVSASNGVKATPLARRFASTHGVSLEEVSGSGPHGRVTRSDVAAKAGLHPGPPISAPLQAPNVAAPNVAAPNVAAQDDVEIVEMSRLQQIIARRMAEAKATIPHFQVQTEVSMDAVVVLRAQLKEIGREIVPSLNDIIVKATAVALRAHPRANGSYQGGRFELHRRVNVGIAVAADDALVVPTITDADRRSLGDIAVQSRRLAELVRTGKITPADLTGATFTVSNLGMYGMTAITPVINPPQAAILGVGAIRAVPAITDGRLTERKLITLTLSCDHRILYGAEAAQFLAAIRTTLEQPLLLAF